MKRSGWFRLVLAFLMMNWNLSITKVDSSSVTTTAEIEVVSSEHFNGKEVIMNNKIYKTNNKTISKKTDISIQSGRGDNLKYIF